MGINRRDAENAEFKKRRRLFVLVLSDQKACT
jgi:hypothetical protein